MKAQPKQRSRLDFSAYGSLFVFWNANRRNSCGWEKQIQLINIVQNNIYRCWKLLSAMLCFHKLYSPRSKLISLLKKAIKIKNPSCFTPPDGFSQMVSIAGLLSTDIVLSEVCQLVSVHQDHSAPPSLGLYRTSLTAIMCQHLNYMFPRIIKWLYRCIVNITGTHFK